MGVWRLVHSTARDGLGAGWGVAGGDRGENTPEGTPARAGGLHTSHEIRLSILFLEVRGSRGAGEISAQKEEVIFLALLSIFFP